VPDRRRTGGPFLDDDRFELLVEELLVGEHQLEELCGRLVLGGALFSGVGEHEPHNAGFRR
jgi:hypothetical protein